MGATDDKGEIALAEPDSNWRDACAAAGMVAASAGPAAKSKCRNSARNKDLVMVKQSIGKECEYYSRGQPKPSCVRRLLYAGNE